MNDSDHTRWSEDLGAYALGALEPSETAEVERHLEGCERCRRELRWLRPAVQALPETVERQEPPPRLRESLMTEVRADAQKARLESGDGRRSFLPASLREWGSSSRMKLAAGFAVAVLAVGAAAGYEIGRNGSDPKPSDTILFSRQVDGIRVTMVGKGDGGTLRLANVGQLPPDKVLEAWVLRRGKVEAVPALFVPDRHGRAETTIADMSGVAEVMVTREPRGGSETPTSKPIVAVSVPQ